MKSVVRKVIDYLIAILTLPLLAMVIRPSTYDMDLWVICMTVVIFAQAIYFIVVYRTTMKEIKKHYPLDEYTERSFSRMKKFLVQKNDKELLEKWSIVTHLFICVRIMWVMILVTIGGIICMEI